METLEAPLNLTFGVEMELVVRCDPERYSPRFESDNESFWDPSQKLSDSAKLKNLVRADIMHCLQLAGAPVHDLLSDPAGQDMYSKWTIGYDTTIVPRIELLPADWAGSEYTGVEIKTHIFYNEGSMAYSQLLDVIKILNNNFSVFTNDTCELHVHTGNGTNGFPLATVKNLAFLVTIFERQFNSLHPIARVKNSYCRPPGKAWPRVDPAVIAAAVEGFKDLEHLVEKFSVVHGEYVKYHAYNLCNLDDDELCRTIEFRQHVSKIPSNCYPNMRVLRALKYVLGIRSKDWSPGLFLNLKKLC